MAGKDGRVNMREMLERKPLYPAEREADPTIICVTGGAGYIGSRIVARLLAGGHTVRATKRAAGDDEAAIAALDALPGAAKRLRWFQADMLEAGSFDAAVDGAKCVIHAAGVVSLNAPKRTAYAHVIEPTVKGIENVLAAVNRSASVEKVILTSSLAAVSAEFPERGPDQPYSEADWTTNFLQLAEPYVTAKVLAEWEAWAIAGQQDRWRLVAICPGHVYGPPMTANLKCAPVATVKNLLDGSWYPFTAPTGLGMVDLDDVAAAHTLAAVQPGARGRYVLCERFALMSEMAAMLREEYPGHRIPYIIMPFWATAALMVLAGIMSYRWVKTMWHQRAHVDCGRALRELGLGEFIPLERSLKDFAERLLDLGVVPRRAPPAPADKAN